MVYLSEEQKMIADSVNNFAENEFSDWEFLNQGKDSPNQMKKLSEHGFLGVNLPEEYGGGGMTEVESLIISESIGEINPEAVNLSVDFMTPRMIYECGTNNVKKKYLPPAIAGEKHISIALSEPKGGSDIRSMDTTLEEHNGEYILDGEKIWVSNPDCWAMIVWVSNSNGLGAVVLDMNSEGIEISDKYVNMFGGIQAHIFFNDVRIPEENILVKGGDGFEKISDALNWERLNGAAKGNAIAICALKKALKYSQEREQFGKQIGDFQGISWKLVDMVKQLEISRSYTYQAVRNAVKNGGSPNEFETSIAKCYSAEMAERVVSEALQIHGAAGYQQGHPLEYLYRKARARRIGGGTTEMQKNNISELLRENGYNLFDGMGRGARVRNGEYTQL